MSDSQVTSVLPDPAPAPEAVAAPALEAAATAPAPGAPGVFSLGEHWRGYEIGERLPTADERYLAMQLASMERVIVRVLPIGEQTELRRQAWATLVDFPADHVVARVASHEENGKRYEILAEPAGAPFREWIVTHQAGLEVVEALVEQLGPIIKDLHRQGIALLNLRAEHLHLTPTEVGFTVVLSGLEDAVPVHQTGLIAAEVDPLYAPPEAVGLFAHTPGAGLFAWDWWSLGRILQEATLGKPVLGHLLRRDVSRMTPELRLRAEALLLEKDPPNTRAGAVEMMGELHPRVAEVLSGLLASCRDGRWHWVHLQRWLKRETVTHRYELSRATRLFPWKDERLTVGETADRFAQSQNWDAGEASLFAPAEDATSLIRFLRETPALGPLAAKVDKLLETCDLPAWSELPEGTRRTVATALVWASLAEGSAAMLRVRGRRLDWPGLHALCHEMRAAEVVPLLLALTARPFIELLKPVDGEAARALALLAEGAVPAIEKAENRRWITDNDMASQFEIFELALQGQRVIEQEAERLRTHYASAKDPLLTQALAAKPAEAALALLLAFAGRRPDAYGFIVREAPSAAPAVPAGPTPPEGTAVPVVQDRSKRRVRLVAMAASLVVLAGAGVGLHLWRSGEETGAGVLVEVPPPVDAGPQFVPAPEGAPPGLYEEVHEGFGKVIRGPLRLWDIPADREGPPIVVESVAAASADQAAQALIDARLMLQPYPRRGVPAVIAVRVPTDTRVGLMLYDGEVHALVEPMVHFSASAPEERAWARLGERRVVYLGPPPPPEEPTEDESPEPAPDPDLALRGVTRPARPRRRPV
jgi:hypothetical protein